MNSSEHAFTYVIWRDYIYLLQMLYIVLVKWQNLSLTSSALQTITKHHTPPQGAGSTRLTQTNTVTLLVRFPHWLLSGLQSLKQMLELGRSTTACSTIIFWATILCALLDVFVKDNDCTDSQSELPFTDGMRQSYGFGLRIMVLQPFDLNLMSWDLSSKLHKGQDEDLHIWPSSVRPASIEVVCSHPLNNKTQQKDHPQHRQSKPRQLR